MIFKLSLCYLTVIIILLVARYQSVMISTISSINCGLRMHPLESCPEADFAQWRNSCEATSVLRYNQVALYCLRLTMCIIVNERGICSQHSSSHGLHGEAPVLLKSNYTTLQGFVLLLSYKCFVLYFSCRRMKI